MKDLGKPVSEPQEAFNRLAQYVVEGDPAPLDFSNTAIAFADRSDQALRKMARLFGLMNKQWLVGIGSRLGLTAIRLHLPFVESAVKSTIFEQFCGGENLTETQKTVARLGASRVVSVIDYGAEAKETDEEMDFTVAEIIRAIDFAATTPHAPVVSTKMTGLAPFALLEKIQAGIPLDSEDASALERVQTRLNRLCQAASTAGVAIFFDAEESWIQDTIDQLVEAKMAEFNRTRAVVYTTCQLYRHDRLDYLKALAERAEQAGYLLGIKLVRGAYMEKERQRAAELGYPSPIQPDKGSTDAAYNAALQFCLEHYARIALCNASHNAESALLQTQVMAEKNIPRNHPHLLFCQLYGMSDNLTYNLAQAGYLAGKYLPYGPVREVIPFLIRRAQENSTVTGDMSREFRLVHQEMVRRGLVS